MLAAPKIISNKVKHISPKIAPQANNSCGCRCELLDDRLNFDLELVGLESANIIALNKLKIQGKNFRADFMPRSEN
jgi:hypothetical protein